MTWYAKMISDLLHTLINNFPSAKMPFLVIPALFTTEPYFNYHAPWIRSATCSWWFEWSHWSGQEKFWRYDGSVRIWRKNQEGEGILEFCKSRELKVINIILTKNKKNKVTYKNGRAEAQTDYLLLTKHMKKHLRDCKVAREEHVWHNTNSWMGS